MLNFWHPYGLLLCDDMLLELWHVHLGFLLFLFAFAN
jgi:hypothetical protein